MRLLSAVLLALVAATQPVAAQVVVRGAGETTPPVPRTILDAIKQNDPFKHSVENFTESKRLDSLRCQDTYVLPDSLALVHGSDSHWTWLTTFTERLPGYGRWQHDAVRLSGPDTLRAHVVGATCEEDSGQPTIYVEREGYIVGITPDLFFRPLNPSKSDNTDLAMIIQARGALDTAVVHEGCSIASAPASCSSVVSVRVYRDSAARADAEDQAAYASHARAERAERMRIARSKGWPKRIVAAVADGNVAIGMTPEMVRLSWGAPDHVNTTITEYGREEQWVYPYDSYVYFRNGRVDAIQQ